MLRKLLHLSAIIIPVIYLLTDKRTALLVATALLAILSIFEILRIGGWLRIGIVRKYTKEGEVKRPLGSFFYVLSAFITMAVFEKHIAIASLFILSISDPLSSILGSRFGRIRFLGKTLEGTLTFFFSSMVILLAFSFGIYSAVACAVVASLTELFSSWPVDDNLSIPLAAAAALTLFTKVLCI